MKLNKITEETATEMSIEDATLMVLNAKNLLVQSEFKSTTKDKQDTLKSNVYKILTQKTKCHFSKVTKVLKTKEEAKGRTIGVTKFKNCTTDEVIKANDSLKLTIESIHKKRINILKKTMKKLIEGKKVPNKNYFKYIDLKFGGLKNQPVTIKIGIQKIKLNPYKTYGKTLEKWCNMHKTKIKNKDKNK